MPFCACCKCKSDQHAAVSSRVDSASGALSPRSHRISDRGGDDYDDDKAAVKKWREQHHSPEGALTTSKNSKSSSNKGKSFVKKKKSKSESDDGSSSSSSSDGGAFHLGLDETKQPVVLSPRAVQAWQQQKQHMKQQQQQQDHFSSDATGSTPRRQSLRSPYELSTANNSGQSQSFSDEKQQQHKSSPLSPQIQAIPEKKTANKSKPPSTQHGRKPLDAASLSSVASSSSPDHHSQPSSTAAARSPSTQQPQQQQPSVHNLAPTTSSAIPPNDKKSKSKLYPIGQRQHDHEGLKDQMIREVVLQQQHASSSSSSNSGERLHGQVFLQVNPQDAISPRSSLDDEVTSDYNYDDTTASAVSDIFSDGMMSSLGASVDSETRERYILACRLLRTRILTPNPPPIMPMERELLHDLLDRFRSSTAGGSQVAYETLSKLLAQDDEELQQQQQQNGYSRTNSNATANSRQSSVTGVHSLPDDVSSRDGDITVASIREEETGFNAVLQHSQHKKISSSPTSATSEGLPPTNPRDQSWKDEKNPKAMAQEMFPEEQINYYGAPLDKELVKLPAEEPTSSMIRLDGWNLATREQYPFHILGLDRETPPATRVLTPSIMEAMRGFFPYAVSEDNFWLKFSLVRDGSSLRCLLRNVVASQHTIICMETNDGEVFGAFCSTPWRTQDQKWFGTGEAFLWKLKQSRYVDREGSSGDDLERKLALNNEMEVYPYTGHDDMVQYCTASTLAIGGGSYSDTGTADCPFPGEPMGIGLLVDGDLEGGETNACATFANPRLYRRSASSTEFTIRNLEVWTLTPCDTVPLAEQLERQKYFIQEHTLTRDQQCSSSPICRRLPPL